MEGMETVLAVTAAAGIGGTGLGGAAGVLLRRDPGRMVSLMLSFAAGVMVAVVCLDLLTEAMAAGAVRAIGGVLAGYGASELLSRCLDRPEGGRLLVAGAVTAAAIAAHNLPEGMAIGAAFAGGTGGEGWLLAAVIAAHNIPEGMAVAAPLAAGGMSRRMAATLAAATGIPTVAGAAVGYWIGSMGPALLATTLGAASGAMLYVVFGELLPESSRLWDSHFPALAAVAGVLTGMAIAGG